jgi:hypothetical protein
LKKGTYDMSTEFTDTKEGLSWGANFVYVSYVENNYNPYEN